MTLKDINFSVEMYGTTAVTQSTYQVVYTGDEDSVKVNFAVTDEPDLADATAEVYLYFGDSSKIVKPMTRNLLVFSYTLTGTQNDHAGIVRADIIITKGGAKYTRAGNKFRIDTSLEANAVLVEYAVDTLDTVVEGAEEWLLQAQTDFGTAQTQRASEWVSDNDTREDTFDAAQLSRATTFSASETARTTAFNTNETGRSNTFTTNENARQAAAEANQSQAATDHSTAVTDHDTAVADSSLASGDHATAATDHSTAVADHSTASVDHDAALADQEIVDSLQDQFDAVIANATVDSEVINARQGSATLSQNILSVKEQLEQKVGGTVKAELEDLSANVLGAIDGTGGPFNLLSIPQDKSVTAEKLGILPIPEMMEGIDKINLFNTSLQIPENIIDDTYIYGNGSPTVGAGVGFLSSKHYLIPGNTYTITREISLYEGGFAATFDVAGNWIASLTDAGTGSITFVMPEKADHIRFQFKYGAGDNWKKPSFMLVPGGVLPSNPIPYGAEINWLNHEIKTSELRNKPVTLETIVGIEDIQLFNPEEQTSPYIIDDTWAINYEIYQNTGFFLSSKAYLIPGNKYVLTKGFVGTNTPHYGLAYDESDNIVEWIVDGVSDSTHMVYNMHPRARYIRLGIAKSADLYAMQIVPGDTLPAQPIPYGGRINWLKTGSTSSFIVTLPSKIYGVVGKELNVYFQNVIQTDEKYEIDVICAIGKQQTERWTVVPSAAGEYELVIRLTNNGYITIHEIVSTVVITATETSGDVTTIMIGDSVTDSGNITGELVNLFNSDPMNLTLLGVRGTAPNLHEGRSGATAAQYASEATAGSYANPFYNPTTHVFDFAYYMSTQGYSTINQVVIHLGINDIIAYLSDTTALAPPVTPLTTIVDSIRASDSTIKIGLCLTIPSGTQDGFASSYGSTRNYYKYRKNYFDFLNNLMTTFANRENENIYLLPINANLDAINNYPTETVLANSRTTTTVTRQIDPIHPAMSGSQQLADVIYYWIKTFGV